jgi:hypothetical protein
VEGVAVGSLLGGVEDVGTGDGAEDDGGESDASSLREEHPPKRSRIARAPGSKRMVGS